MVEHDSQDQVRSRSHRAVLAVRSQIQPGSLPLLLVASLLLYTLTGLAVDSTTGATLVRLGRLGAACAGLYVLSGSRVTLWLGGVVAGVIFSLEVGLWHIDPQVEPHGLGRRKRLALRSVGNSIPASASSVRLPAGSHRVSPAA